jgi:translation initiation factor IF-3
MNKEFLIGEEIIGRNIRVITKEGSTLYTRAEALRLSRESHLDLIQISFIEKDDTSICKIETKDKFFFDLKKNAVKVVYKKQKKMNINMEIGQHDIKKKAEQIAGFLKEGRKVLVFGKIFKRHKKPGFEDKIRVLYNETLVFEINKFIKMRIEKEFDLVSSSSMSILFAPVKLEK